MNQIELIGKDVRSLKDFMNDMNTNTIQKPEVLAAICRIGAIALVAFGLFSSPIMLILYGIVAHDLYKYGSVLDGTIQPGMKSLFTAATTFWRGGSADQALDAHRYTILRQNLISVQIYHSLTQSAVIAQP